MHVLMPCEHAMYSTNFLGPSATCPSPPNRYELVTCPQARACNPAERWSAAAAVQALEALIGTGKPDVTAVTISPARLATANLVGRRASRRRTVRGSPSADSVEMTGIEDVRECGLTTGSPSLAAAKGSIVRTPLADRCANMPRLSLDDSVAEVCISRNRRHVPTAGRQPRLAKHGRPSAVLQRSSREGRMSVAVGVRERGAGAKLRPPTQRKRRPPTMLQAGGSSRSYTASRHRGRKEDSPFSAYSPGDSIEVIVECWRSSAVAGINPALSHRDPSRVVPPCRRHGFSLLCCCVCLPAGQV